MITAAGPHELTRAEGPPYTSLARKSHRSEALGVLILSGGEISGLGHRPR